MPNDATQIIPQGGMPRFEIGKGDYLFVAADVGLPITRCLTTP